MQRHTIYNCSRLFIPLGKRYSSFGNSRNSAIFWLSRFLFFVLLNVAGLFALLTTLVLKSNWLWSLWLWQHNSWCLNCCGGWAVRASGSETSVSSSTPTSAIINDAYTSIIIIIKKKKYLMSQSLNCLLLIKGETVWATLLQSMCKSK